jgi:hypothetical protein
MRRHRETGRRLVLWALAGVLLTRCSGDPPKRAAPKPGVITTIESAVRLDLLTTMRVGPDDSIYVGGRGAVLKVPPRGEGRVFYRTTKESDTIRGIAFGRGFVFVTEAEEAAVRAVRPNGGMVDLAGTGSSGRPTDGAPAALSPLACPSALAYSTKLDALLIGDGVEIRTVDRGGRIGTVVHQDQVSIYDSCTVFPAIGLATDPDGRYYDATSYAVFRFLGQERQSFPADPLASPRAFDRIVDFIYDAPSRAVYVADSHRVKRIAADGAITVVAGNGDDKISGDGGRALDAGLGDVVAVDVDRRGNLYIATQRPPTLRIVGAPLNAGQS